MSEKVSSKIAEGLREAISYAQMQQTLDAARERIAELEKALTFYADEANWRTRGHPQIDAHDTAISFDRGARARNALRPHEWCTDPVACRAAGRCPHDPVCGN